MSSNGPVKSIFGPALSNLAMRFPSASEEVIANALANAEGHAGKAAQSLTAAQHADVMLDSKLGNLCSDLERIASEVNGSPSSTDRRESEKQLKITTGFEEIRAAANGDWDPDCISFKCLKVKLAELGLLQTDDEIMEMMDYADTNGDGVVNREEFDQVVRRAWRQGVMGPEPTWSVQKLLQGWQALLVDAAVCRMLGQVNSRTNYKPSASLSWGVDGSLRICRIK